MTHWPTFRELLQRSFVRLTLVVSAVLVLQLALLAGWIVLRMEQREQSVQLLRSVGVYHNVIRSALAEADPEATRAFLAVLRESAGITVLHHGRGDDSDNLAGYGFALQLLQLVPVRMVQWIDQGQRYDSSTLQPLGLVPPHWREALTGATTPVTLSEPQGSPLLEGALAQTGVETLLIPVSDTRAVALMSPSRALSPLMQLGHIPWLLLAAWTGVLLALALPALVVGAWLARRDARPLSGPLAAVAKVARSFSNEDFSARVQPLGGSAETVAVGAVLNELGQRMEQTLGELRASRNELQRLLDLQRRLLTDISHELRTPLAAIMLHTEFARDSNDTHELRVIAQEGENMKRLVQDIFDLVRLETGHLKLDQHPTDVDAVVDRVVGTAVAAAGKRGVRLKKSSDSHPGLVALADAQRLEQVLHNLVNNAVRHTMAGGSVELKARVESDFVVVDVADTGEGIAPNELPHVFKRFWRGDHARAQQDALRSSGLGLAIVKELVEAMGGAVAMHSRLGVGTTVEVRMRLLVQRTCQKFCV